MKSLKACGFIVVVAALLLAGMPWGMTRVQAAGSSPFTATPLSIGRCSDTLIADTAADTDVGTRIPIIESTIYEASFTRPIHDWFTFTTDRAENIQIDVTRTTPVGTGLDTFLLAPYDAFPADPGAFILVDFNTGTVGTADSPSATTTIGPRRIKAGRFYIAIRADVGSTPYTLRIRRGVATTETLPDVLRITSSTQTTTGQIVVNKFRPSRYPATVNRVTVGFRQTGGTDITGTVVTLVIYRDPSGSGQPGAGAAPVFAGVFTLPRLDYIAATRTFNFDIVAAAQPVITSGDYYAGVSFPMIDGPALRYDTGAGQAYAWPPEYAITFVSTNGGLTWANKSGSVVQFADIRSRVANLPACAP